MSYGFASRVGRSIENGELSRLFLESFYGCSLRASGDEQAGNDSQSANRVAECLHDLLARGRRLFNFFNTCSVSHI